MLVLLEIVVDPQNCKSGSMDGFFTQIESGPVKWGLFLGAGAIVIIWSGLALGIGW